MRQNLAEDINLHLKPIRTALSLKKLERIDPVSSSEPVISHNHMLRPNAYLSCQLSGDRNTEDSYDRRNGTGQGLGVGAGYRLQMASEADILLFSLG